VWGGMILCRGRGLSSSRSQLAGGNHCYGYGYGYGLWFIVVGGASDLGSMAGGHDGVREQFDSTQNLHVA
jgi:hypothetical protein